MFISLKTLKLFLLITLICSGWVYGGDPGFRTRVQCIPRQQTLRADSSLKFGFPHRLKISINNEPLLIIRDYTYNIDSNIIELAFMPRASDSLCLEISESPILARHRVQFYRPQDLPVYSEDFFAQPRHLSRTSSGNNSVDHLPEYRLNYGGNKSISVSVGNEGGLSLNQSLLLDVDGQIAENVFIKGHLSDQEIPIQPEGNSATLREIDQIYAKVYGKNYSYILGDHLFKFGEKNVDEYLANVQGIQSQYSRGQYRGNLSYSLSRGQYNSYTFEGQFGKQTGYFLRGEDGQEFVTVLAGTEKIWRNGILLIRGREYQIEYGEGRVDFLNTLIVSGRDQFTVEFQYTDRDFPSTLFSGGIADTLGPFTWDVRGITEIEDKDNPESFILTSGDEFLFSQARNKTRIRTLGYNDFNNNDGWVHGLYFRTGVSSYFEYVSESEFDSLVNLGYSLFTVRFNPEAGGAYVREFDSNDNQLFRYAPTEGGYGPGEVVTMPTMRSHITMALKYGDFANLKTGHASSAYLLGSGFDQNLYSNLDDKDNQGYGVLYNGGQTLGSPIGENGLGKLKFRTLLDYKEKDYQPFQQVIEPHQYRELWNLPNRFGINNYFSQRYILEDEILKNISVGSEYGYLDGSTFFLDKNERGLSERLKGFTILGSEDQTITTFIESKKTSITSDHFDNYKWGSESRYRLGLVLPSAKYSGDEWISKPAKQKVGNSYRQELSTALETDPIGNKVKLRTAFNRLHWTSNFNGALQENVDSLSSWDVSQRADLFDIGPWQSDIFVSYQTFKQRDVPDSDMRQNDFRLLEWNNRLQDHKKGYTFYSSYKINQTVDIPLIEVYLNVAEGNGTHVCDTLVVNGREILDCVLNDDKGDMEFLGLRRDSLSKGVGIQELNWSGNTSITLSKMMKNPYGVLADIHLSLRYRFSNKQDSSTDAGVLPLFTDKQVDEVLEGKTNLQPILSWNNQKGNKTMQLLFEREYFGTRIRFNRTEILHRQSLSWSHDINYEWSYNLRQSIIIKERISDLTNGSDSSISYSSGGDIQYRIRELNKIIPILDYEFSQGVSSQIVGAGLSSSRFELHSLFPRLRLEREFLSSGRIFIEYGLNNVWGSGEGISRYNGNDKGLTHRIQSGIDLQIGQYVYATGNYLIRKEPDRKKLFQNLSLEIRAIF